MDVSKFFKQKEDELTKWGFSLETREEDFRNFLESKETNILIKYINAFPKWGGKGLLFQSTMNRAYNPDEKVLKVTNNIVKKIYDKGKIKNFAISIDCSAFFTHPSELPEIEIDNNREVLIRKADLIVFKGFDTVKFTSYGSNKLSRIIHYLLEHPIPFIITTAMTDKTLDKKILPETFTLLKKITRKVEFRDKK